MVRHSSQTIPCQCSLMGCMLHKVRFKARGGFDVSVGLHCHHVFVRSIRSQKRICCVTQMLCRRNMFCSVRDTIDTLYIEL